MNEKKKGRIQVAVIFRCWPPACSELGCETVLYALSVVGFGKQQPGSQPYEWKKVTAIFSRCCNLFRRPTWM